MDFIRMDAFDSGNSELIMKLMEINAGNITRFERLQKYYRAENPDIKARTFQDASKPNNKPAHAFCSYIVDTMAGYFLGVPIAYKTEDDDFKKVLQDIFDTNDEQSVNSQHAKNAGIYGCSIELVWLDEAGQIRISPVDMKQVIPIYSNEIEPQLIGVVRFFDSMDYFAGESARHVEVYDSQNVYFYTKKDGELEQIGKQQHFFNDVPFVLYKNNDELQSDFERVIDLVYLYDLAEADTANNQEYFNDAYLVLKGLQGTTAEDVEQMKEKRVMLVDENGDASFLIKESDYQTAEVYKTRLENDIHKFSGVPNLSTLDFGGAVSGTALKFRFFQMEQIVRNKERLFKKALMRRIKLINNILSLKGYNFNHLDITPVFVRNVPINKVEEVDTAQRLYGIVSHDTLLNQLSFIDDSQKELQKLKAEQEKELTGYEALANE